MKIGSNEVIDPTYKGNLARLINHSCEPTCITVKWNVLGETCIGIFALRQIEEDEELTFDYQFDCYQTPLTKCLCGTKNCKGYLGLKPTEYTQEEWDEMVENMICVICNQGTDEDEEKLILCDKCNRGFHTFCLSPPIEEIPREAWYCDECKEELAKVDISEEEKRKAETLRVKKTQAIKETRRRAFIESDSEDEQPIKFSEE